MLRSPPLNGGLNSPSTPNVLNKRPASDLMDDSPPIDNSNITKKANVQTVPATDIQAYYQETIMPKSTSDKTVTFQKVSNNKNKNVDNDKILFNIPTSNKFSELSKTDDKVITTKQVNNADLNKKNEKIIKKVPPITIVGAVNFSQAISIVSEIAKDKYLLKYMSIGVKIQVENVDKYEEIKSKLIMNNIEFYSHDINPEKFEQYVLSGISKIDTNELLTEITNKGFEVSSITEITINKRRFNDEGMYRVTFKGKVDHAKLLRIRLNYTVVKWKRVERKNKLTQCHRCQNFGHGMRNCNISFKCSKCGDKHESSTCTATTTKCANCGGDHGANDAACPKRKTFIEMRQKMSGKGNFRKPSKDRNTPQHESSKEFPQPTRPGPQLDNDAEFPELPRQRINDKSAAENVNHTNQWSFGRTFKENPIFNNPGSDNINLSSNTMGKRYSSWASSIAKDPNVHHAQQNNCGQLFSAEECSRIFRELVANLQGCHNKTEQLEVMFEIATKYVLNDKP